MRYLEELVKGARLAWPRDPVKGWEGLRGNKEEELWFISKKLGEKSHPLVSKKVSLHGCTGKAPR